jgi:hypothetical protein
MLALATNLQKLRAFQANPQQFLDEYNVPAADREAIISGNADAIRAALHNDPEFRQGAMDSGLVSSPGDPIVVVVVVETAVAELPSNT